MHDRGIDADHQVQIGDDGCGVGEVPHLIHHVQETKSGSGVLGRRRSQLVTGREMTVQQHVWRIEWCNTIQACRGAIVIRKALATFAIPLGVCWLDVRRHGQV